MEEAKKPVNPMLIVGALVLILIIGGIFLASKKSTTPTNNVASSNPQISGTNGIGSPPEGMELDEDGDEFVPVDQGSTTTPTGSQITGMESDSNAQVITIEGGSFYYKPNEIRVKVGTPVKIVMTAKDMMHDFTIDALNVKMPITKAGQTGTVEFTPTTKGTFEFYCSVGNHRAQGQVGKLIVE